MTVSPLEPHRKPAILRLDRGFQPCSAEPGDELYPNGIFEFNVTPPDNADEIIAYDVTDKANWNPGQYLLFKSRASQIAVLPPISIKAPTTTFRKVYESILRRLGYNPKGDAVKEDVGQDVLEHINDRFRFAWSVWDWPQINAVEWRALRTVWTSSISFVSGDELYYFGEDSMSSPIVPPARTVEPPEPGTDAGYYTCIADAPPGTLPTDITYFSPLTLTDRYIEYSQPFENPIGELLDAYNVNPRTRNWRTGILNTAPSSKGIDFRKHGHDIVWIRFRFVCPQFTLRPFIVGATETGDAFYDPDSGNCWYYSGDSMNPKGALIPFPLFMSGYVKPAAFADCLLETAMEAKTKMAIAAQAHQEALDYLTREIDNLAVQGQRMFYPAFPQMRRRYGRPSLGAGAIPLETFGGFG